MSRTCAKPTCSSPAVSWFDMARETQEVTRTAAPTDHGMALCQTHADRFGVPVGWTLREDKPAPKARKKSPAKPRKKSQEKATKARSKKPTKRASKKDAAGENGSPADGSGSREHDRDNPWFVSLAESANSRADEAQDRDAITTPTEGSMLDRAFNGPKKAAAEGSQPPAKSDGEAADDADFETSELPFPPHSQRSGASASTP